MPVPSIDNLPKVGLAFSGGGLRAMLNGGGVFDGLDSRSNTAQPNLYSGQPTVNGLLDWTTYIAGTLTNLVKRRYLGGFLACWCVGAK
jgi:hypothetical protein